MKKYSGIIVVVVIGIFVVCFSLYKANCSEKTNQGNNTRQNVSSTMVQESSISDVVNDISSKKRNTEEILFTRNVSGNELKLYAVNIDGKNLRELATANRFKNKFYGSDPYSMLIISNWRTVNSIENHIDAFKEVLNHPVFAFSKDFYAYCLPIEESDIVKNTGGKGISGGGWAKGVFVYDVETGKTIQIDKALKNQLPSSSFSKDGNLFVRSISFSHNGQFLFVSFLNPSSTYGMSLAVFSIKQTKFTNIFDEIDAFNMYDVDMVGNKIYFLSGTDSSNVFEFNITTNKVKSITNCLEASYAVSPDSHKLVFTEFQIGGKSDLGVLNLSDYIIKKVDYQNKEIEIVGFVGDSKHLVVKHYYKLSDTDINYHTAIYLLNLDTLKEARIYTETG